MINAELGSEKAMIKELLSIEGLLKQTRSMGVCDIVVKVDLPKLKEVISRRIRSLTGVRSTLTMMVIE